MLPYSLASIHRAELKMKVNTGTYTAIRMRLYALAKSRSSTSRAEVMWTDSEFKLGPKFNLRNSMHAMQFLWASTFSQENVDVPLAVTLLWQVVFSDFFDADALQSTNVFCFFSLSSLLSDLSGKNRHQVADFCFEQYWMLDLWIRWHTRVSSAGFVLCRNGST